ncbi:MAG: TrbI/VirB10 family protein [Gammaproteobacteria bacterium]|jgi:polyhydroxyalkanoate synthesis regulator phasin
MAKITEMFRQAKKRNLVILLIIIIVVALFIGFYLSRSPSSTERGTTQLPQVPSEAKFTPGAKGLSKEYLKTLLQSEQETAQQALQKGKSALPTLIGTDTGTPPSTALTDEQKCGYCCRMLQAYCQKMGRPVSGATNDLVNQMQTAGEISPDAAAQLKALADQGASVNDYKAALDRLVKEGKLTPEQAKKLLAAYRKEHGITAPTKVSNLADEMADAGQISEDTADQLNKLANQGLSVGDYKAALDRLVKAGKLTPEQAKKLLAEYRHKHQMQTPRAALADKLVDRLVGSGKLYPEDAAMLKRLSSEGVLPSKYGEALNRLVKEGKLSPAEAQRLLSAYVAQRGDTVPSTGDAKMDALNQSQEKQDLLRQQQALNEEQAKQATQMAEQQADFQKQQAEMLAAAEGAVKQQAQKLFAAWNVVPQQVVKVSIEKKNGGEGEAGTAGQNMAGGVGGGAQSGSSLSQFPLIKAGTIMFGVLDTAVNSDRAGPVMATLVSGKYKGAKLLGSLSRTSDGQRVVLKFNQMSMPDWPDVLQINAVAMNPDDAHTAIASSVDNHYLLRYGSLFAASFLSGYSEAITNAGTTSLGLGVIQVTHPNLSTRDRTLVGLGEVGKNLSDATRDIFDNTKPTVRVNAGVGIGVLFMSNVSKKPFVAEVSASKAASATTPTTTATTATNAAATTTTTETKVDRNINVSEADGREWNARRKVSEVKKQI